MKTYKYKIDGAAYDVTINEVQGRRAKVVVNGISFDVEMQGTQLTEDNCLMSIQRLCPMRRQLLLPNSRPQQQVRRVHQRRVKAIR